MPSSTASCAFSSLFWRSGLSDDHLRGRLRPDELRQELRAAPAGDDREEDLREADVADVRRERARVAVQRELEPAAERRRR